MADPERRRRRLRQGVAGRPARPRPPDDYREPPDPDAAASMVTSEVLDPDPPARPPDERETERGLRGLVGSGSSQVGISAAMRARDAARPTDADLAEAQERLIIVRRGWVPRDDPPRGAR
ncbi:hypothetical protein RB614_13770 [Phytohabitans sp. ZYX-F-186]|uniref:Uncharacterized protein n=1 Tax=Phytohabitans maris TaxID=3071409 RepID=A0ABU0ZEV1_9ACTN|nr:hypothetical protein [Phytohabitans sp. ZYX-F-186]MDQ7905584.1 hypothetical protein [Phytohabitans sp. ZYX-F-186]